MKREDRKKEERKKEEEEERMLPRTFQRKDQWDALTCVLSSRRSFGSRNISILFNFVNVVLVFLLLFVCFCDTFRKCKYLQITSGQGVHEMTKEHREDSVPRDHRDSINVCS